MRVWANGKRQNLSGLILMCCLSQPLHASEFSAHVKTASLEPDNGWYVLEADVDYRLSPIAKEALQSSISLTWDFKIQLKEIHYFHDKTLVDLNYHYKIRYHALLNSYSVTNETTHAQKKYTSLSEALDAMSRIREIKVIPISALKKKQPYQAAIKLEFNKEQLPSPLRPLAYLNSDWNLSSDWYLWHLQN